MSREATVPPSRLYPVFKNLREKGGLSSQRFLSFLKEWRSLCAEVSLLSYKPLRTLFVGENRV